MIKNKKEILEIENNVEEMPKNIIINYNSNELYNNFKTQLNGWIESLDCALNSINNKSILIYQTMVIIEILIKTRIIKMFNITSYNDRRNDIDFRITLGESYFCLNQIKHNVKIVLEKLLDENTNISRLDKIYFSKINDYCEQIFFDISTLDINNYPDLRYNHNKDRIILVDNNVSKGLKDLIKEVINYARL
ncbi:MAG: hypothetical protein ACM3O4_04525 [Ignavibacteriales bacterium]